jgi:ATP-dependent RNA helicase DeaD
VTDQPPLDRDPGEPSTTDPEAEVEENGAFAALGLAAPLVQGLTALGYEEPTPIQREAIPPLLAGRDVLAEAPTGTGKTAAFALPMLQRLAGEGRGQPMAPRGLVLVPTRELAMQVAEAIHRYGQPFGLHVLPVYGGQAISQQTRALRRGVDIVVATPGRAVDHLTRGPLSLATVEVVVLDEADEMLDMGFAEDLETILSSTPTDRQTALFSATISRPIARIAGNHLRDPIRVQVRPEHLDDDAAERVRQVAYVVRRADKPIALGRILDLEDPTSALVFARTRGEVDELAERLAAHGHDVAAIHGGMTQEQRDRVMGRFRDGSLDILVATDVAARGLDIDHVSHVVNFDIPSNHDAYVHRIGRTGRAGRSGVAITLVEPREHRLLRNIEGAIRRRLDVAPVPSISDLRERRLEALETQVRDRVSAGDLDRYRPTVESLAGELDPLDVAMAALALAEDASGRAGVEDGGDIAPARLFDDRPPAQRGFPVGPGGPGGPARPGPRGPGPGGPGPGGPRHEGPWVRLWVGVGRSEGLRPQDLVGAITHEAGVPGRVVGAIRIAERHALVDVAADVADGVVNALRGATIRGRTVPVRPDREGPMGPPPRHAGPMSPRGRNVHPVGGRAGVPARPIRPREPRPR